MKQFLVFAGDVYYPAGGWYDFIKDFDTQIEASNHADELVDNRKFQWAQVIDQSTGKEVDKRD